MEAATRAAAGLEAVRTATERLFGALDSMDEAAARAPSLCAGWSRAHVGSHLARNADALVNLLTWAGTGVERPMYTSRADRDADIEAGAQRPWQVIDNDLRAACERFEATAAQLSPDAWSAQVIAGSQGAMPAHELPWVRAREVWIHLVDLDCGARFDDVPSDQLEEMVDDAVRQLGGRAEVPAILVQVDLPDGRQRSWNVNTTPATTGTCVRGAAASMLAWLTGRGNGEELAGQRPALPDWL